MIAIAIAILSVVPVITAASTVPSGTFTIKELQGAALGNFDVTGAQRNIHLTAGLTYEITCKQGSIPGLVDQRWYRDGSAVEKRNVGAACSSQTEVFYSDEVGNSNHWILTFCHFDSTLAGSFTCRPSSDYNKTLIIGEGEAHTAARVVILCLLQAIQALLLKTTSLHLIISVLALQWASSCLACLLQHLLT